MHFRKRWFYLGIILGIIGVFKEFPEKLISKIESIKDTCEHAYLQLHIVKKQQGLKGNPLWNITQNNTLIRKLSSAFHMHSRWSVISVLLLRLLDQKDTGIISIGPMNQIPSQVEAAQTESPLSRARVIVFTAYTIG